MDGSQNQEAAQRNHNTRAFENAESSLPLQQLNHSIAFRSVKLPSHIQDSILPLHNSSPSSPLVQVPSFCFNGGKGPAPKPLLDIEDVRAFFRSKFGPRKPEIEHGSTRQIHTGVFGIGTMGFSGSDGGYVHLSSSQASEGHGEISSHPFAEQKYGYVQDNFREGYTPDRTHDGYVRDRVQLHSDYYYHFGSHRQPATPLLDLNDVRYTIDMFLHKTWLRRHPTTSLANRLPWYEPRAPFLAKGLEWPRERFESEEARKAYYRKARKRKPFLLGSPPLWTVTAFNLAFLQMIMYNPVGRFYNYLMNLP
ncbi:hypothetical protein GOP47_0009066 [Adiantum capillus-veneris]|uniref:Uncharacterized protein n=1 Tax=Adiantum capillus-veneris TaxID=13818 RepID=A0A9D4V027_ADICA|nr:hypothetical protein GOP47_0009066 [Adiantum capillus-veneris]